ncbi:O-antigen ligase family protein [Pannonibacter tanglangensis]|uniref:O-antigen ligase-related domain-containing protein n=1 Tax=Pannonibacter tanglangensis TaxID=2750084 RepID=A0ABW9ZC39_9HYPH|nr:O-antigen ligase family protein [Pannonibacter sp. XCT-34]NBN62393.1 hypothetical protein [Pannonibacter sp. XCT-34]
MILTTGSINRSAARACESDRRQEPFLRRIAASMCLFTLLLQILVPRYIQLPGLNIPLHFTVQFLTLTIVFASSLPRKGQKTPETMASISVFFLVIFSIFIQLASTLLTTLPQMWETLIRDIVLVKCMFFIGRFMGDFDYRKTGLVALEAALLASFVLAIVEQQLGVTFQSMIASYTGSAHNEQVAQVAASRIREGGLRSSGLFEHPIVMSVAAGAVLPWFFIYGLKKATFRRYVYCAAVVSAVLLAAYFSRSRTSVLAIGVGVSVFFAIRLLRQLQQGKPELLLIVVSTFPFFAPAMIAFLSLRLTGGNADEAGSTELRRQMWEKASSYLSESPFIGWGMGNDLTISGIHRGAIVTIDDTYLSHLLTVGGLGLISFIALGMITFVSAMRAYLLHGNTVFGLNALAIASAICAIYAGQITNSIDHMISILYALVGFWSIKIAKERETIKKQRRSADNNRPGLS